MVAACYDDEAYLQDSNGLTCVAHSTAWKNTMRPQLATADGESPDFVEIVLGLLFDESVLDSDVRSTSQNEVDPPMYDARGMASALRTALQTTPPTTTNPTPLMWETAGVPI